MNPNVTVESLLAVGEEMRKKIVASASPEERLAGLTPEDLHTLLQQIDRDLRQQTGLPTATAFVALQEKRQMLLRVLRHKFGELPAEIVQRIATTVDAEQINSWLDQALDAAALDAIHFDEKLNAQSDLQ